MAALGALVFTAVPAAVADDSSPASRTVPIYATAAEDAIQIGSLDTAEDLTPVAESQIGGSKWYLVRSRLGIVGWIKQSATETSKKVEKFFKSLPLDTSALAIAMPRVSSSEAPRGAIIVPVATLGRASTVSVTFNQTISADLLLDTGATRTVISRRIAKALALPSIGNTTVHTVGGPIPVHMTQLRSIKIGDAEITGIPVIVHDFSPDPRFEGLLGMDVLGRFKFGLDAARRVLVLAPR